MACSFNAITGSACGSHSRTPVDGHAVVPLNTCRRDIKAHLKLVQIPTSGLGSEVDLILARVGIFEPYPEDLTICPLHRGNLGIHWKTAARRCQIP